MATGKMKAAQFLIIMMIAALMMGGCNLFQDDQPPQITVIQVDENDEPTGFRREFVFNDKGVIERINTFEDFGSDKENVAASWQVYLYNDQGKISAVEFYERAEDPAGESVRTGTWTYTYTGTSAISRQNNNVTDFTVTLQQENDTIPMVSETMVPDGDNRTFEYHWDIEEERWSEFVHVSGNQDVDLTYDTFGSLNFARNRDFVEHFNTVRGRPVGVTRRENNRTDDFDGMTFVGEWDIRWRGRPETDVMHPAYGPLYGYGLVPEGAYMAR